MEPQPAEHLLCDPIVPARGVEHALAVAATDMDAEGDAGMAVDDGVVELDARVQQAIRIAAALPVSVADRLVEQGGVLRRVDLHVLASKAPQFFDFAPREVDDIRQVRVARGVGALGLLGIVVRGRLLGAEQRDLDGPPRPPAQIRELLHTHLPPPTQLADDHRPPDRHFGSRLVMKRQGPAAELVEAFERVHQVAEEGVAAHFAIGDDGQPLVFLEGNGSVHCTIFDSLEHR